MARQYMQHTIEELETIMVANRTKPVVLAELLEELQFRRTDRGKQLRREVQALLDGTIPPVERKLRRARPEDQLKLLDPE